MKIELSSFIQRITDLPVTKLSQLDAILSDLANHLCEIEEYTSELKKELANTESGQVKTILDEMIALESDLKKVYGLFYKLGDYDSHYMDRSKSMLDCVWDNVKELIAELKKI